jgi:predicted RND superfamily exporter protein
MRNVLARIAGWCVERPAPVLAAALLIALVGVVAALRLEADAGTDQLVDRDSDAFVATEEFKRKFGDDAVVVLVKGDLERLVLTEELGTLLGLEGCLSGNAPGGRVVADEPAPAPCAELAESKPARVVYGPATFLNQFATQAANLLAGQSRAAIAQAQAAAAEAIRDARREGRSEIEQRQVAIAAAQQVLGGFQQQLVELAVRYGQVGVPRIDDPRFVSSVVFDSREQGQPKPRFSYLFPSAESALVSVRLRPELTESERHDAIGLIRAAVADPAFRIRDAEYVVSGVPVVVDGLSEELEGEISILLAVAVAVMALTLALVLGPPLRLLPLAVALGAAALTFGGLAAFGGALTMASLAVLPILIGLAVDYAIQFHARFTESLRAGASPPRAAVEAASRGGPVIATAMLATGAGFLVLLLSPIPMIRGFGLLLVAGVAVSFVLAVTAGLAILSLHGRGSLGAGRDRPDSGPRSGRFASLGPRFGAVGEARRRTGTRIRAAGKRVLAASIAAPGRVLVVALVVAAAGWALGTRTEVISDIRELVPRGLPELENVDELQEATGVSGEVDVTVTAPDISDPELIAWMRDFKARVLERAGFEGAPTSCIEQETRLCPSISLPDVFGSDDAVPSRDRVRGVLALLPRYFSQAVASLDQPVADPKANEQRSYAGTAVIAFGIKVMPFDEQKELIDGIRAEIDPAGEGNGPPDGVSAEVVGLPVLAADANSALSENRYLLTLAGLAAVALALLAAYRSLRRALVPLIPIVFATGWSALGLAAIGVPLNPMSATLGALVIAIATEFSVLIAARFEEERRADIRPAEALRLAYARTGAAVLASGLTAIAGFAALIATDIRMLRDFGLVTVLDLGVALIGVLVVLPAALVWAESGFAPARAVVARLRRPRTATS